MQISDSLCSRQDGYGELVQIACDSHKQNPQYRSCHAKVGSGVLRGGFAPRRNAAGAGQI